MNEGNGLDLAIVGGTVVAPDGQQAADVGIRDGRVALLAAPGALPAAQRTIDAAGLLVLPGIIDAHFHHRAPAYQERGDWASESAAAAAGGVTTLFEMPITMPPVLTAEVLNARRALGEQQSYVDFALFGTCGTLDREAIRGQIEAGAIAFKIFMHAAPLGREDEFVGLCLPDDGPLYQALELVAEFDHLVAVHCESEHLIELYTRRLLAEGDRNPSAHPRSRPPVIEALATARLMAIAEATEARVHVVHASVGAAVAHVRATRDRGYDVSVETCPQYLYRDASLYEQIGPYAKINPPLRDPDEIEAMWAGIEDGTITMVTSDHGPFLVREKEVGWEDIFRAPAGAIGVEVLLPLVMKGVDEGRLDLGDVVRLLCTGPAQRFGVYPQKGALVPGSDGDVTLWDPSAEYTIDRSAFLSRGKETGRLYEGLTVPGRVHTTIVRGEVVFQNGQIVGRPGHGRFVRPL